MEHANFYFEAPQGKIYGHIGGDGVERLVLWDPRVRDAAPRVWEAGSGPARELREALEHYFSGEVEDFAQVPLAYSGTPFQRAVWEGACKVAWGRTATYGELTAALGLAPGTARAVGAALGANPLHLLVPCHRFLGANGALTGYAGGLSWKQALLEIEGSLLPT